MANITADHLHHLARRHHATMKQLDGLREKFAGITNRFVGTVEVGAGAWLGGIIEGRTGGATVAHVPINLVAGAALLAAGHLDIAGSEWSEHLNNIGNGFLGSYVAATGYAFGKRWGESGKLFGGSSQEALPSEPVRGDLTDAQMAAIVQRMQAAAAAPSYP